MYKKPDFEPDREQMMQIIENSVSPIEEQEVIMTMQGNNRICAEHVCARHNLPNLPVSAFDGISVRFDRFKNGMPDTKQWKEGVDFCFSNTGVAIDERHDTVIAIEDIVYENGILTVKEMPQFKGQNVGAVGSQIRVGECILRKGQKITPQSIGLLPVSYTHLLEQHWQAGLFCCC